MNSESTSESAAKNRRPLRVLLVEDSEADATILTRAIQKGGFACTTARVQTPQAMQEALVSSDWDVILADHAMPGFSAPEALKMMQEHGLDRPFIIVSGLIEEETAVAAMRAGAHDYVMKDHLARLVPAIERELREAKVRKEQRDYQEQLKLAREQLESKVQERTADLQATNAQLHRLIEERRRLENELLDIAENERRRIGFDLHDDLGQKLTGASLMVKGLEKKLASQKSSCVEDVQRIAALIEQIVNRTHDLAHQFSSLDLRGDDPREVLRGLAENAKKMFDIPCAFSSRGDIPELPEHSLFHLHKIAQEAVSNAVKHGKATEVTISLHGKKEGLVLTIKNDGLPFVVPESAKGRMGLRIMNYRASTIGGTLDIKPADNGGTLVTCLLPTRNGNAAGRAMSPRSQETLATTKGL